MLPGSGTYRTIVKQLGPHGPDGLLAFVFFVAAAGLILSGFNPWAVVALVVLMYGAYAWRQTQAERHRERAAEFEVAKKAADLQSFRERHAARIEKEKVKALGVERAAGSKGRAK